MWCGVLRAGGAKAGRRRPPGCGGGGGAFSPNQHRVGRGGLRVIPHEMGKRVERVSENKIQGSLTRPLTTPPAGPRVQTGPENPHLAGEPVLKGSPSGREFWGVWWGPLIEPDEPEFVSAQPCRHALLTCRAGSGEDTGGHPALSRPGKFYQTLTPVLRAGGALEPTCASGVEMGEGENEKGTGSSGGRGQGGRQHFCHRAPCRGPCWPQGGGRGVGERDSRAEPRPQPAPAWAAGPSLSEPQVRLSCTSVKCQRFHYLM